MRLASQLVNQSVWRSNSAKEHFMIRHSHSRNTGPHTILQAPCSRCLRSSSSTSPTPTKEPHLHLLEDRGESQQHLQRRKSQRKKSQKQNNTLTQTRLRRKDQLSLTQAAQMMSLLFTSQRQGSRKARESHQRRSKRRHLNQHPSLIFSILEVALQQSQRPRKSKNLHLIS